jgi:hypothetical protein
MKWFGGTFASLGQGFPLLPLQSSGGVKMIRSKLTFVFAALILILSSISAKDAECSRPKNLQEVSGTVEAVSSESVIVRSGSAHYEFFRDEAQLKIPPDIQVGDEISVGYTLKMQKFKLRKVLSSHKQQQPGQTGQDSLQPILDDRAFYDA